ncbi:hypothetical protein PDESU_04269 [Pontiella desulfatans]|uniref:Uncharacterized protein n=1 Tax=Pontiella desulfatans TaxID=2750659 RepID=A0A6C2U8E1_PONDE|nr:hypothetical protein [Pontiella desulfatans]VGO15684.1 hypothetical protein PDESU_04269 [Pontiella desulfatans]
MLSEETWQKLDTELKYENAALSGNTRSLIENLICDIENELRLSKEPDRQLIGELHCVENADAVYKIKKLYDQLSESDKRELRINLYEAFGGYPYKFLEDKLGLTHAQEVKFIEFIKGRDQHKQKDPIAAALEWVLEMSDPPQRGRPNDARTEAKEILFCGVAEMFKPHFDIYPSKTVDGRFVCFMEILLSDLALVKLLGKPMTCNSINKFWKKIG